MSTDPILQRRRRLRLDALYTFQIVARRFGATQHTARFGTGDAAARAVASLPRLERLRDRCRGRFARRSAAYILAGGETWRPTNPESDAVGADRAAREKATKQERRAVAA